MCVLWLRSLTERFIIISFSLFSCSAFLLLSQILAMTDGCFKGVWIHPLFCGRKIDSMSKQVNFCVTCNIWLSHKWSHEFLWCTASKPTVHIKGQISLLYLTWFSRWMWIERPTQRREMWLDKHSVCHYHQITEQQFGFLLFLPTHVVTFNSSSLPEFVTNKWSLVGCETRSTKSSQTAILTVIQLNFTYITLIKHK